MPLLTHKNKTPKVSKKRIKFYPFYATCTVYLHTFIPIYTVIHPYINIHTHIHMYTITYTLTVIFLFMLIIKCIGKYVLKQKK